MPDPYTDIKHTDKSTQQRLAELLEMRAANDQQQVVLEKYFSQVQFPADAKILEVGCGTGPVIRFIAGLPGVGQVTGIDPSPIFIERARELAADLDNVSFRIGDGRHLPFEAASFDVVTFHTTICHLPEPQQVLLEAFRVLKVAGVLSVFDGDYTTTTVSLGDFDPLQACADAWRSEWQHDAALMQRLPLMVEQAGFQVLVQDSHEYSESTDPGYMLTIVDRGATSLENRGIIGPETSEALKREARHRADTGRFRGSILYKSLIARKSGVPTGR
jgi:ubiquinone/menaquinone biosynthesis C-methylase UbiE